MGYYTNYSIKAFPRGSRAAKRAMQELKKLTENHAALEYEDDCGYGHTKWYDSDDHMIQISEEHPKVVFVIDGDGEEDGDLWRKAWHKGRNVFDARATLPDFDPKPLLRDFQDDCAHENVSSSASLSDQTKREYFCAECGQEMAFYPKED